VEVTREVVAQESEREIKEEKGRETLRVREDGLTTPHMDNLETYIISKSLLITVEVHFLLPRSVLHLEVVIEEHFILSHLDVAKHENESYEPSTYTQNGNTKE
jgi:hypothetical protein